VDPLWYDIGETEDVQRGLMRDDGLIPPRGKPGGEDFLARRGGIVCESVEASLDAEESAPPGVVRRE
jgi:hypothetical protein